MLILSFVLVLSFAVLTSSALKIKHRPGYLLSIYLLFITNIVVSGLIANSLGFLNNMTYYLIFELVLIAVAWGFWSFHKNPSLLGPWNTQDFHYSQEKWRKSFREWKVVWVFAVIVFAYYFIGMLLILFVPPNTNDSLLNHLARVGYWLQHGSMAMWPTPSSLNIIYPVNANLLVLWSILFSGGDSLSGFIQWTAALSSAVAIYSLSRLLGWAQPNSLFAGLLWLTLPEILFQSTTTQQDLIVASLFIISIYFLYYGLKCQDRMAIILSGLAFGLSMGTKQIVLFTIPGLLLFLLIFLGRDRKGNRIQLLICILASIVFTLMLGSYIYFQNIKAFGNPLGDQETLTNQIQGKNNGTILEKFIYNNSRLFYQSIDFSGIPPSFSDDLIGLKSSILKPVFEASRLNLESTIAVQNPEAPFVYLAKQKNQEDESWYGLIGFFLLIPISIIQLIKGITRKDTFRIGLVLMSYSFWIMVTIFRPGWELFEGRYLMITFGLLSPFFASIVRQQLPWKILDWTIVIYVFITSAILTINNQAKPLLSFPRVQSILGPSISNLPPKYKQKIFEYVQVNFFAVTDIWNSTRSEIQIRQAVMMVIPNNLVSSYTNENAAIALGFSNYLPVYPFFGEHLTRRLFPVYPPDKLLDKSWFQDNKIDFLLLHLSDPQMPDPPSWLIPYHRSGEWGLYYPEWVEP